MRAQVSLNSLAVLLAIAIGIKPLDGQSRSDAGALRLSTPKVLISSTDARLTINRSLRVAVSRSGRIAVAEDQESFVGVLADGSPLRRIGRKGSGPGEFNRGLRVGWLGDTMWVVDDGLRRTTTVVDGRVLKSTLFIGTVVANNTVDLPTALTQNGAISRGMPNLPREAMTRSVPYPVFLTSRDGRVVHDTLFMVTPLRRMVMQIGGSTLVERQWFSDRTIVGASGDGEFVVRVEPRQEQGSNSLGLAAGAVMLYGSNGQRRYVRGIPGSSVPVSSRIVDSVISARVVLLNRLTRTNQVRESDYRRELYVPSHYPPVTAATVANDGTVFLRGNTWGVTQVIYTVLDPTGRVRGTFQVPVTQYVIAADGPRVFSVRETDDGAFEFIVQLIR